MKNLCSNISLLICWNRQACLTLLLGPHPNVKSAIQSFGRICKCLRCCRISQNTYFKKLQLIVNQNWFSLKPNLDRNLFQWTVILLCYFKGKFLFPIGISPLTSLVLFLFFFPSFYKYKNDANDIKTHRKPHKAKVNQTYNSELPKHSWQASQEYTLQMALTAASNSCHFFFKGTIGKHLTKFVATHEIDIFQWK